LPPLVRHIAIGHLFIGEMNAENLARKTVCGKEDGAALAVSAREP